MTERRISSTRCFAVEESHLITGKPKTGSPGQIWTCLIAAEARSSLPPHDHFRCRTQRLGGLPTMPLVWSTRRSELQTHFWKHKKSAALLLFFRSSESKVSSPQSECANMSKQRTG